MSPERAGAALDSERIVLAAIASALRRARWLAVAEAIVWGLAASAISVFAGIPVAIAVAAWRWRQRSRAAVVRLLERAHPDARNLLVTADELSRDALAVKAPVRMRVFADAAARAQRIDLGLAFPIAPLLRAAGMSALAWTIVAAAHVWRGQVTPPAGSQTTHAGGPGPALATRLHVSVAIQPPPYTGVKETTAVDPEQLQAIEGSTITLAIDSPASSISVDHDGQTHVLARGADGRFADRLRVTKTGYVVVAAADGVRRVMPIVVSPDALPAVRLTAPGRDLVYAGGNPRITFDARATDDFGLRSLVLRYTKVTGSGENFEFKEGEIPLAVKPANPRDWSGSASRSLADLDLKDGDMLVYHAVAADARPGDGSASSDAFFIEISKLGIAAGDAFTLPEEESKYALSQQMLIVKTERLQQKRATLAADDLAEQSLNLAVEQRMIRAEFVFMLGGEINDEEVEAEQSVELQGGRLQNRGQRDLRTATIAMSQAEKLLTGVNIADALTAERAAVTALQRAFSRDRYILRALATRSQLDASRRLTGSLGEAGTWHRVPPDAPANRRAALLQDLLRELGSDLDLLVSASPVTDTSKPRSDPRVLAEEAIRIDPASAQLRQAAADLQRAAGASDQAVRSAALASAAAAIAAEARRADAGAPLAPLTVAPALSGAFADALRRER